MRKKAKKIEMASFEKLLKKWTEMYVAQINKYSIWHQLCDIKPRKLTKAEIKRLETERMKEIKRRAKKITMTVGELEDKLEEARDYDY